MIRGKLLPHKLPPFTQTKNVELPQMIYCPYCGDILVLTSDGWRCTECEQWITQTELDRMADGACPWCGRHPEEPPTEVAP